jgi:hypothetical protein
MKHRIVAFVFIIVMLVGVLTVLQQAHAQAITASAGDVQNASVNWVDANTVSVQVGSGAATDFTIVPAGFAPFGYTEAFTASTCTGGNTSTIATKAGATSGEMSFYYTPSSQSGSVGGASDANIQYILNGDTITSLNTTNTSAFVQSSSNPQVYLNQSDESNGQATESCADRIVVPSGTLTSDFDATLWELARSGNPAGYKTDASAGDASGCYSSGQSDEANGAPPSSKDDGSFDVRVEASAASQTPTTTSSTGSTSSSCAGTNQDSSTCQTETVQCSATLTNPISWLVCPIVSSIQDFMNYVGSEIESYLTVPNSYFDSSNTNGGQQIYVAWDNMRNIALALLGIFALIMVFSQALSVGPFDAYTVKKLLPRILISAVLVTLSWPLISLAVGISNGVGEGLRSLIFAPFRELGTFNLNGGDEGLSLITGLGLGAAFGLIGTLSFALTAILALITGLVVIVIRQLILILLAILAPVALVCYILPGTDRVWKLWWDSFFGVLIMFPLIEAFIAVGSVFAAISTHGNNPLDKIIGFVALYLPYFLLPATVRFAGGALRTIGGQVQGGHMSLQGGLGNFRKGQREKLRAAEKIGERWHGQSWIPGSQRLAHRADQISKGVGTGFAAHYGIGRRGESGLNKSTVNAANEYMQSADFAPVKDYDAALQAKTYRTAQEANVGLRRDFGMTDENQIRNAIEAARVSGGFGGNQGVAAAKALVNTGTGYANLQQMTETLARASGGNAYTATDLAGYANNYTKQVGRNDLAPSFGVLNGLVQRQAGYAAGGAPTAADYDHALDQSFIQSGTLQPILAGRAPAMQAFANRQLHQLEHGNQVERRSAAINLLELQKNIQSTTGANRDIINRTMFRMRDDVGTRVGVDFNAGSSVAEQLATIATHGPVGTSAVDFEGRAITAETLNGMARVYSNDVPGGLQQQGQLQPPTTPPPPPP